MQSSSRLLQVHYAYHVSFFAGNSVHLVFLIVDEYQKQSTSQTLTTQNGGF
jgi:hypothetical protein